MNPDDLQFDYSEFIEDNPSRMPKILDMGGSGVGSALHGRAETAASFLMSILISYQTRRSSTRHRA